MNSEKNDGIPTFRLLKTPLHGQVKVQWAVMHDPHNCIACYVEYAWQEAWLWDHAFDSIVPYCQCRGSLRSWSCVSPPPTPVAINLTADRAHTRGTIPHIAPAASLAAVMGCGQAVTTASLISSQVFQWQQSSPQALHRHGWAGQPPRG